MDTAVKTSPFVQAVQKVGRGIKRLFTNETFLYIIKRIGRSLITLVLLIIIVISLIRAIPDNQLYDLTFARHIRNYML